MKLMVATGNAGKLREIERLLDGLPVEVLSLKDLTPPPEIVEDGATFADNALKKARTLAQQTGMMTLADDSGLVVDLLDGAPGIHSARYAGSQGDDAANNAKLLRALGDTSLSARTAAFVCVMALVLPDGATHLFEGRLHGLILPHPRGTGGFGYDPLFLVPEYGKSLAELSLDTKNRISHRGQALRQAVTFLKDFALG